MAAQQQQQQQSAPLRVAILGAGISGLEAAHAVKKRYPQAELTLFEKEPNLGGTWYTNTYPGAACDIMSHLYSVSFSLNPNWSQCYSSGPEISRYLIKVAADNDITRHCRFRHKLESARWDAAGKAWVLTVTNLASGETLTHVADFFFCCPGALCEPSEVTTPGVAEYLKDPRHTIFHSARWQHDVSLKGKRVAVVGTGASAAQIIPGIVGQVEQLYVLQRTPAWVVPRGQYSYSSFTKKAFTWFPFLMVAYRFMQWVLHDLRYHAFIWPVWPLNLVAKGLSRKHLAKQVSDPALREALTPHYPMGCKRVVCSDDVYPALARPNCTLIPSALASFTPTGILTSDGQAVEVDAVVLATGFDVARSFPGIPLYGEGGVSLQQRWSTSGPEAYYGILLPSFPNLAMLVGPGSGLGHSSIIAMIECQVGYAMQVLDKVTDKGKLRGVDKKVVAVKQEAHEAYNTWLQATLSTRVWANCVSWYNLQGQKNVTMWPLTVTAYWWYTRTPAWKELRVE